MARTLAFIARIAVLVVLPACGDPSEAPVRSPPTPLAPAIVAPPIPSPLREIAPAAPPPGCFTLRREFAHPRALFGQLADFDHDGRPDLLVSGALDNYVDVLLGIPGGGFFQIDSIDIGGGYIGLTVADFDRDGHLDFAASSHESQTLQLYHGAGDGSFALINKGQNPPVRVPKYVGSGVAADLTNDGFVDLALPVWSSLVLLKNERGRLRPGLGKLRAGQAPQRLVAADLDRDGRLDLLAAGNDTDRLDIFMAQKSGPPAKFKRVESYPCNSLSPGALAVADLTGDGHLDVAMTHAMTDLDSNHVCIFRGDGRGGFEVHATLPVGYSATAVQIADLTADGHLDLVIAAAAPIGASPRKDRVSDGSIEVYAGDGAGAFEHHSSAAVGTRPMELWLVDSHGDAALDLVALTSLPSGQHSITVLMGRSCQ